MLFLFYFNVNGLYCDAKQLVSNNFTCGKSLRMHQNLPQNILNFKTFLGEHAPRPPYMATQSVALPPLAAWLIVPYQLIKAGYTTDGRYWYIGMARVPHMRNTNMHGKISAKSERLGCKRLLLLLFGRFSFYQA